MEASFYLEHIKNLLSSEGPGFTSIKSFVNDLWSNRSELHITNAFVVWDVELRHDVFQRFHYFADNIQVLLNGLDINGIINMTTPIDSHVTEYRRFEGRGIWKECHLQAIPIFHKVNDECLNIRGAVILLSSTGKINIDYNQLQVFHSVMNANRPNIYDFPEIKKAKEYLSSYMSIDTRCDVYKDIGQSLDNLACGQTGGLCHYSLWEVLQDDNREVSVTKVFNRNILGDTPYKNCHIKLNNDCNHYLTTVVIKEDFNTQPTNSIKVYYFSFAEVFQSFKDANYFNSLGINESNGTVVAVVEKIDNHMEAGYVSCYYVKNIVYSPFISPKLFKEYSSSIYTKIYRGNQILNSQLLQTLIVGFNDLAGREEFYEAASDKIADFNEAETCLIYLSGKDGGLTPMVGDLENYVPTSTIPLPPLFASDRSFVEFIESLPLVHEEKMSFVDITKSYSNTHSNVVQSASVIFTYIKSSEAKSVILLINKNHQPSKSSVFFNNMFSIENFYKLRLCGLFLNQYKLLRDSIDNKNYLLKKFRHEIPNCTSAIKQNLDDIRECVATLSYNPYKTKMLNKSRMIDLNVNRISLLASFFSTVDFDDKRFAEERESVNMRNFLSSYIDIFRSEGLYRGVDVSFTMTNNEEICYYVSNYFLLSIVNVIINATRYAAPGTCVNVIVYQNHIDVIDIGIPIAKEDEERIYDEGYRGKAAKKLSEKGMGYGLYLTKRIIEAHGGTISAESNLEADRNLYAEHAVMKYINSLSATKERDDFIFEDLDVQAERMEAMKIYNQMKSRNFEELDNYYINTQLDSIRGWISYNRRNSNIFLLMNEMYFKPALHRVKFTINI